MKIVSHCKGCKWSYHFKDNNKTIHCSNKSVKKYRDNPELMLDVMSGNCPFYRDIANTYNEED